jgi:hypothetical protein
MMTDKEVWIVSTKSSPLEGCDIDIDGCDFYFAEAFVPVASEINRLKRFEFVIASVEEALLEARLTLVDASKCLRYVEPEWGLDSEMEKETHAAASNALASNSITFSPFRSEEIEELCRYRHAAYEINA